MTTTNAASGLIPADLHLSGFVAVAIGFPAETAAHRAVHLYHRPDGTDGGTPVRLDGSNKTSTEIRPACQPDSNPAQRLYELSIPFALARGAVACDQPECFGGTT